MALVANGEEVVVWRVAAAELVLPCGGELVEPRVIMVVVVVEGHEVGDGFSGELAAAFDEDHVEVHH